MLIIGGIGAFLGLALSSTAATYKPVTGFEPNRHNFYQAERRLSTVENSQVRFYPNNQLRVAHFDAHFHGLTIDEYLKLSDSTKSDILVARGVPEREGYAETVKARLIAAGFDKSSLVESPCAALTSGMVVGLKNGITLNESHFLTLDNTNIALEANIVLNSVSSSTTNAITLIVLSLDVFDRDLRVQQLGLIHKRLLALQKANVKYLVMGGMHANVRISKENTALLEGDCDARDAFFVSSRLAPNYTSWWGVYTDTTFVSGLLQPSVVDAQVWHTDVDCLPILVDFDIKLKGKSSTCCQGGFSINRMMSFGVGLQKYWKVICLSFIGLLIGIFFGVYAARQLKRMNLCQARKIQATLKNTDPDLKVRSNVNNNQTIVKGGEDDNIYPSEKN